ncbi:hypothetical protein GGS24DRAFT_506424 [Hypoxylon argillaceum]|nr:hypothetical protein GGS24DRAFT_506424 [Hypoxylon argillaceum]
MPKEDVAENNAVVRTSGIDLGSMVGERSLGTVYSKCFESFQWFLARFNQDSGLQSGQGLKKCYEEYSKLHIWGHQNKVTTRQSVSGSLAATLQDHQDIQSILLETYEQIIDCFDQLGSLSQGYLVKTLALLGYHKVNDKDLGARPASKKDSDPTTLREMWEWPIAEVHVDKSPFCQEAMTTKDLFDHMADHMKALALISLVQRRALDWQNLSGPSRSHKNPRKVVTIRCWALEQRNRRALSRVRSSTLRQMWEVR